MSAPRAEPRLWWGGGGGDNIFAGLAATDTNQRSGGSDTVELQYSDQAIASPFANGSGAVYGQPANWNGGTDACDTIALIASEGSANRHGFDEHCLTGSKRGDNRFGIGRGCTDHPERVASRRRTVCIC